MAWIQKRTWKDRAGKTQVGYQVRGKGLDTRTFPTKEMAIEYRDNAERRDLLGPLYKAEPETVAEAVEAFVRERGATKWKPNTLRTYEETAKNLAPLGDLYLKNLDRRTVGDWLADIASIGHRRAAQKAQALLNQVLRDAAGRGQAIDPAIFTIPTVTRKEREPVFLTVEQLDRLAGAMPEGLSAIVTLAGLTGMRRGEVLALRVEDLHLNDGYLFVREGKTRTARRRVELPAPAVQALREHLLALPPEASAQGVVFPTPRGYEWDGRNFMTQVFRKAREVAEKLDPTMAGVTFHDLRHTAISLMAASGAWSVELIARQVGHADGGALILRTYRHCFPGELTSAADAFGAAIEAARKKAAEGEEAAAV